MIKTSSIKLLAFVIFAGVFASCGGKMDLPTVDDGAWLESVHQAWKEQDDEFKNSPTSPLAGASRIEIPGGESAYFVEKEGELIQSGEKEEGARFQVETVDGKWKWNGISDDVTCLRMGEPVESGSILSDGDLFQFGTFSMEVYPVPDLFIALVFDSKSPLLEGFTSLKRFEANSRFKVAARFERFENPEPTELKTARNRIKTRYKYGVLKFEIDGQAFELFTFRYSLDNQVPEPLFVPFTDKTTGKESYGGGRYLAVDEPIEGDQVVLDFNLATNPLCNYTPIYNCIVPPRENKLDIEILAGEKKYH